jgi:serine/threonine protein kinase/Tfp pilus assembly protein PilF
MGEVYRARDPRLGRDVAVKVISDGASQDPERLRRFEQEARAVAALSHPNILAIFDIGVGEAASESAGPGLVSDPAASGGAGGSGSAPASSRVPFLVTELLDGETLRALVARGPLNVQRTVDIALQLIAGLAAAHGRGIVHRDLKPDNIFITVDGRVKILDFGLARHVAFTGDRRRHARAHGSGLPTVDGFGGGGLGGGFGSASGAADPSTTREQTVLGTVLGTLGYMAPEQVRGHEADQRADIFAYGAILFEMLTGERAFHGDSPADVISALLNDPPAALVFGPGTPPALAITVRRCLQKDAHARFQSARDVASALDAMSDLRTYPGTLAVGAGTSPASVAVLPFANMSTEADNQYFSDGLAEELINALSRLSGLRVASRTSSFRFRGSDADVRQIGRELGVGAILEGSVRRAGTRLRITARLTSAADGYLMWSERYDREMADVFEIQDEIVESIVSALAPALVGEAKTIVRRATENLEAYELYLKGRHFWNQRSPAVVGTAIRFFEEAIALDPKYALAYAGLADCYSILRVYGWTPPEHSQPRALDAVTRALALEPELPEAHFSHALYTFHFERHWRTARRHFEEALALSPQMAMFEAYFGLFLAAEYDYPAARQRLERAIDLDPHSAVVHFLAASAACVMGDLLTVERHCVRALELQPDSLGPRWPETVALLAAGRTDEALAVGERVIARTRAPIYLGVMGMIYGRAGRLADARRLVQELDERQARGEYVVPAARLSVHLGLNDEAEVRSALAACVDGGAAPFSVLATNRWLLDTLRGDPEIDRLLDRLHDGARP